MIKLCTWLTTDESLIYWYLFRKVEQRGETGFFGWAYSAEEGVVTTHLFKMSEKSWRDVSEKNPPNIEKTQREIIMRWFVNAPKNIRFLD